MLKTRLLSIYSVRENIQCPIICFVVYTPTQLNMLSHVKYRNSNFTRIKKNINNIKAPQCKKQNCSRYNLLEKIYNALFYSVFVYIHILNMLSHVKYRNFNCTRIEKNLNNI